MPSIFLFFIYTKVCAHIEFIQMIEFKNYLDVPEDFTGICKFLSDNSIRYYKNGLYHREGGPALEFPNGNKYWYINGLVHREDGPATEHSNGFKNWRYKNRSYGKNEDFINETWIEKIEYLKREEELKIFK